MQLPPPCRRTLHTYARNEGYHELLSVIGDRKHFLLWGYLMFALNRAPATRMVCHAVNKNVEEIAAAVYANLQRWIVSSIVYGENSKLTREEW